MLSSSIPAHLPITNIQMLDLRKSLGELVERSHYQFQQFRILRKDRPMARLVNEPYMQAIERLLEEDPAIAETLEIMLDKEMMTAIEQGQADVDSGDLIPIEAALED